MQTCKCSVATSRTSDHRLNPSVISFSSTEMAANRVNWAISWANWFFDAIGKHIHPTRYRQILSKRKASISLPAKIKGFCRKTKNTVLLLPKFTISSSSSKFIKSPASGSSDLIYNNWKSNKNIYKSYNNIITNSNK